MIDDTPFPRHIIGIGRDCGFHIMEAGEIIANFSTAKDLSDWVYRTYKDHDQRTPRFLSEQLPPVRYDPAPSLTAAKPGRLGAVLKAVTG